MQNQCNIYAISTMQYQCLQLQYLCNINAKPMQYKCKTNAISMQYQQCNIYAISMQYLCNINSSNCANINVKK